jgi:hypothetical protein
LEESFKDAGNKEWDEMKMKIIKHGVVKPKGTPAVCTECGCVFEYNYSDVRIEDRPCSGPYVVCPESNCGTHVNTMVRLQNIFDDE